MDKKTVLIILAFFILCILFINAMQSPFYQRESNPTITCSDDGKIVYIVDGVNVYISTDTGNNWIVKDPKAIANSK